MYEAVLVSLQAESMGSTLYLANLPLQRIRVVKEGRAPTDRLLHSAEWVREMWERGLVAGSCTPPVNQVGCRGIVPMAGPSPTTIQFGPLAAGQGSSPEIVVTLVRPPSGGAHHIEKWLYRLERTEDGRWRVASQTRTGVT